MASPSYPGDALRVFGPPGTGKTTYLAKRVAATVAEHGPESTMVSSFSVTAAKEVASRFKGANVQPAKHMIGTLHSHAYRACEHPPVALDPKVIADWNEQVEPTLKISGDTRRSGGGDSGGGFVSDPSQAVTGDELIGAYDKLRATLVPPEDWPLNVREFAQRFEDWKRSVGGALDYTDMILGAWARARDGEPPPGNPSRFISDEAQDMTPLEFELSRAWGALCERWVIAGDDDQAINRWRGGDPEPLLALFGDGVQDHILDRSYRVPEAVRAAAELWVKRLSHRKEKVYGSRLDSGSGEVVLGAAYHVPDKLNDLGLVTKVVAEVDKGNSVMILTACNYMLDTLISNLRSEGVPFHNPYRPGEAKWNPLGVAREGTVSTAERVAQYLKLADQDWIGSDVQSWMELIKLDLAGMRPGSKKVASQFPGRTTVDFADLASLFADEEALALATEPSLDWLSNALLASKRKVAEYPIHVARQHGGIALSTPPKVVVGTIHAAKGTAADIVYLSPEISAAAVRSMTSRAGVDETIRQFYVGMTRAYKELRIMTPASANSLRPSELIPPHMEVLPHD